MNTQVLSGRCLPYGDGITFGPVLEIMKSAAGITESGDVEALRSKLRTTLEGEEDATAIEATLAAMLGLVPGGGALEETYWGVRRFPESLARDRPLVVVVDDLHWSAPPLLEDLRASGGTPSRPEEIASQDARCLCLQELAPRRAPTGGRTDAGAAKKHPDARRGHGDPQFSPLAFDLMYPTGGSLSPSEGSACRLPDRSRDARVGDAVSSTFARRETGASAEASRDERGMRPSASLEGSCLPQRADRVAAGAERVDPRQTELREHGPSGREGFR